MPRLPCEKTVFCDIEAAGLGIACPIIQIAAIAVDSRLRELETFEVKIRFQLAAGSRRSLAANCFEPTVWKRLARQPIEAARLFADFLRRHATVDMVSSRDGRPYRLAQLAAHNADFDGPRLRCWFRRQKEFLPASQRVFCTLQRAMWLFHEQTALTPPTDYRLATLCEYFGVPFGEDEQHDALADARATVAVYRAMVEIASSARRAA